MLCNDRRTATIKTVSNCDVWLLEGSIFKKIVLSAVRQRRNIELSFLDKVDIFKYIDKYEKLKLVDGLTLFKFSEKDFIVKEGEEGEYFYIIEEGVVECLKDPEEKK